MTLKANDLPDRLSSAFRWIALTLVVIAFAGLCFWILAPWQLGKNSRTETYNKTVQQALAIPAMPLSQVHHGIPDEAHIWRLVTISGHFIPTPSTTERLRLINEEPAIKFLTAFQTDTGKNIIIYRGYQTTDQPYFPAPPAGHLQITARMYLDEAPIPGKENAIPTGHGLQIYSINSQILSHIWKLPLEPGYFALENDSPGVLLAEPLPELKTGPYLSYGIQWIAFGILAPIGLIYLIYQERKNHKQLNAHKATSSLIPETTVGVSAPENVLNKRAQTEHPTKHNLHKEKKAYKKQLLTQLRGQNAENFENPLTEISDINPYHPNESRKNANIGIPGTISSANPPNITENTESLLRDRYGKKS